MTKRKLQFKHLLIIVVFLIFTNSYAQEDYWDNPEVINMSLDSADQFLKDKKSSERTSDSLEVIALHLKDSLKAAKKLKRRNRYRKNSIRLDLLGKSFPLGVAYDRIIYHNKFDLHLTFGIHPFTLLSESFPVSYSYYTALYGTFTKYKIKPNGGVWYNKTYLEYNDGEYRHMNLIGAMIGADFKIGKRWSIQATYNPLYAITVSGRYSLGYGEWNYRAQERLTGFGALWGGLNLGYKF